MEALMLPHAGPQRCPESSPMVAQGARGPGVDVVDRETKKTEYRSIWRPMSWEVNVEVFSP